MNGNAAGRGGRGKRVVLVAAVAVGTWLGLGVGHTVLTGQDSRGGQGSARGATASVGPTPTPGVKAVTAASPVSLPLPGVTADRATADPGAGSDDGSAAANQVANWPVITPGTPAAWYWAAHGVTAVSGEASCEAALRVQYVSGYQSGGNDDAHQPLWKFECDGVSDGERDNLATAALEWSATQGG